MNKLSQLKNEYASQVEKAPWLAWALPAILALCIMYVLLALSDALDEQRQRLDSEVTRLNQLRAISADSQWAERAEQVNEQLQSWRAQVPLMTSKTLTQAEILTQIQSIATATNMGSVDVVVGEPVSDSLNPKYMLLDINIRIGNTNGFAFEEFWSRLLSEIPTLSIYLIDVLHRRDTLQGRMSAQLLVQGQGS